jgi:hypothetical protein
MHVGHIAAIYRYPVKSMQGESLAEVEVGPSGVVGDREWCLRDEKAGELRGGKKLPRLLECHARYATPPREGAATAAEITLPDGTTVTTDDAATAARLTAFLGREVTLWPRLPAERADHYLRAPPDNPDLMAEWREIFGRLETEPLPDISGLPPELGMYTSPLGTYHDAFPIDLLTTASLAYLTKRNPTARFDPRRFRPTFLIETPAALTGLVELTFIGKSVTIGGVRLDVRTACPRCSMTLQAQGDLPKDPSVLRTIVAEADQNLSVYATVAETGAVRVGDAVAVEG